MAPPSRLLVRRAMAALLALTMPELAYADPMPVHTATAQVAARPTTAQRIAVADAIARVFSAGLPEVLSGVESHARVQTLVPSALSCADADCAPAIQSALGARAVVMVRMDIAPSRRLRLSIEVIDRRGQSLARTECEEPLGDWDDALALARIIAQPLAERVRLAESNTVPVPSVLVPPTPAPTRLPAPLPASLPEAVRAGTAQTQVQSQGVLPPPSVGPPPVPHSVDTLGARSRRPVEALLGATLLAGGFVTSVFAALSVARDGSLAPGEAPENAELVYVAGDRDYVLLGVGAVGSALGAALLIDGLRLRAEPRARVRVNFVGAPGGGLFGLRGCF